MHRRDFLKGLIGLAGTAALPSGLVVPDDAAEPLRRLWPGWRADQSRPTAPYDFDPGTARPIWLMAGDSLQLTYTVAPDVERIDVFAFRRPASVDVVKHRDGGGYTILTAGLPIYQFEHGRAVIYRPDLFDVAPYRPAPPDESPSWPRYEPDDADADEWDRW